MATKSNTIKAVFLTAFAVFTVGMTSCGGRKGGKIAMIVPFWQYDQTELRLPMEKFRKAGFKTTVVSSKKGTAHGNNDTVKVDLLIDKLDVAEFDAVVFVGGLGYTEYSCNETAHSIARETLNQNKVLAAICAAPVILANAGVLKGRNATGSTGLNIIEDSGASLSFERCTVDGNIVTANGPAASGIFADAIIGLLKPGSGLKAD